MPKPPTTPQPETLGQKLIDVSAGIRQWDLVRHYLGREKEDRLIRRLARIQQDAYAKHVGVSAVTDEESDEVHIGDTIVQRGHSEPWKALAVGGVIALLALALALWASRPSTPKSGQDTDTQYELGGDWQHEEVTK